MPSDDRGVLQVSNTNSLFCCECLLLANILQRTTLPCSYVLDAQYCVCSILTTSFLLTLVTGKNPYDLRQNCTDMGDNLCYDDLAGVHNFLNLTETKLALGVDPDFNFQLTNTTVNQAFYSSGQAVHNSAALLPELVNSGVRLLAYAGDTGASNSLREKDCLSTISINIDGLCNYQVERFHGNDARYLADNYYRESSSGWSDLITASMLSSV